jgi:signal transduction histidine kinase
MSAEMIAKGYYGSRITERSDTREISQLTTTVNELAETLEEQELLRKRLTADVAHELRTPLAILRSHLEAMIDGIWETNNDRLRNCHEEVMRISRMVNELEELARYESDSLNLNRTRFDAADITERIIRNFENDSKSKGITIAYLGEKALIYADQDKIGQVVINLLTNALKYAPTGGRIDVSVKSTGLEAEIRVRDNGIGISDNDLPFIFERFYRVDRSRHRQTGGLGIGLAIAKAIVEAHRGTINVKSKLNDGTEFTVAIPLAD